MNLDSEEDALLGLLRLHHTGMLKQTTLRLERFICLYYSYDTADLNC